MQRIVDPGLAVFAISIATANEDPPDTPVRIPSETASFFAHSIPSAPETGANWS